jgi:hypothetical protein
MTLERDRREKHRSMERAIEIHREMSRTGREYDTLIPPITPEQRRGKEKDDGDD